MSDSVWPHRWQPTRLPRPWDSPGKNTGVGCHFLLQCMKLRSLSHVRLLATPWTAAHQAPLSMGFSRQEYGSGVPLPSPRNLLEMLFLEPCLRLTESKVLRVELRSLWFNKPSRWFSCSVKFDNYLEKRRFLISCNVKIRRNRLQNNI